MVPYLGNWDLVSLTVYTGIALGSPFRQPGFSQSQRVDCDFSWFPIWGARSWPVSPGRPGIFVVPHLRNGYLASLTR